MQPAVVMPLDADEEEVTFSTVADTAPPQPYLQYGPDDSGGGGDRGGSGAGDSGGGGELCFRTRYLTVEQRTRETPFNNPRYVDESIYPPFLSPPGASDVALSLMSYQSMALCTILD